MSGRIERNGTEAEAKETRNRDVIDLHDATPRLVTDGKAVHVRIASLSEAVIPVWALCLMALVGCLVVERVLDIATSSAPNREFYAFDHREVEALALQHYLEAGETPAMAGLKATYVASVSLDHLAQLQRQGDLGAVMTPDGIVHPQAPSLSLQFAHSGIQTVDALLADGADGSAFIPEGGGDVGLPPVSAFFEPIEARVPVGTSSLRSPARVER